MLRRLPIRPPFGWSPLLSIPPHPPSKLVLSPAFSPAHPLTSHCLAWLTAMHDCPRLQLHVFRTASALLQRCRKTTREGGSQALSLQQELLLEIAALGLMRSAGGGCCWQPMVCADAAVAAMLRLRPTHATELQPILGSPSDSASAEKNQRSLIYVLQQTLGCVSSSSSCTVPAINYIAALPDGSVNLPSSFADCTDSLLLLVCACSSAVQLPGTFVACVSKSRYVLGCSITCGRDGKGDAVAVYMLDAAFRAQMDDVFKGAKELSHELDACGDGVVDDDGDDVDGASTFGFFMSPAVAEDSSLLQSGVSSALSPLQPSSSTSIAKAAGAPNFSCTCSLAIHCVGLVPLRSAAVQLALHALLRGSMRNLLSLSLRLLPTSLILPDLQNSLSRLACLQHLSLQLGRCSPSDSASIMHAIAHMPQLSSLQLQGLDLSDLRQSSAPIAMAAPISSMSFSDVPPPPVAVAAAAGDSTAITTTAATMPLSHIALILDSCTSTLQSLTITGKQDNSIEQTAGSWRLLCHAIAPCFLLHTLDVSKSGIDAVGCVGLAHCLRRLVRLIKLDVSGNPLAAARVTPDVDDMVNVGAGVHMLANALEGLTGLTSLLIRKCCFNRCGTVALLQALHAHTSLTHLAIGGNQYSGLPHAVHELVVINEGFARMTCASHAAAEYDACRAHAEAIRAVLSGGESMEHAVGALQAALAAVNMRALAAQLLQPIVHCPPAALPQLLLDVIGNNRALISLDLADLCLPLDALPLLATAWLQGAVPPIHFGDFRCRVDACAGHARQVAAAWAAVVQAAVASYERQGRTMPQTLRWHSFV